MNHYKEKRILGINHQLPWMVIRPSEKGPEEHNLYDLTCSKISNFQFGIDRGQRRKSYYKGCSHGWLFVIHNIELLMFNPISGISFRLPPLILNRTGGKTFTCGTFARLTLSRDPSTCFRSQPFEVLVASSSSASIFCKLNVMAHWKSGDRFWTCSEYSSREEDDGECYRRFHDFIFYKDRMLGISSMCSKSTGLPRDVVDVISINIDYSQAPWGGGGVEIKKIASTPRLLGLHCQEGHLVETTKGELLMVHRYDNDSESNRLKTFRVYKLILCSNHSAAKIIPIKNLDGDSLFLGRFNHSISVLASNYPACMPNSIYYATTSSHSGTTLEVFNVEDDSVSYCCLPAGYEKVPLLPWIVPSMKL